MPQSQVSLDFRVRTLLFHFTLFSCMRVITLHIFLSPQRPLLTYRKSCRRFNLVTQMTSSPVPESWTPVRPTITASRKSQRTPFINNKSVTLVQTHLPIMRYSSSTLLHFTILSVSKSSILTQISYIHTGMS